jgi:DNA-binding LytR/AlgR family response regulator
MNPNPAISALIAEDEPVLAEALRGALAQQWPELNIVGLAQHGQEALDLALAHAPDVLFLDIRMPGLSGLEVAADLADAWPPAAHPHRPFPLLVFVTAYDQYAVAAFEAQAADYVLKPWREDRLQQTIERLQARLSPARTQPEVASLDAALAMLRPLLSAGAAAPSPSLTRIAASQGQTLHYVAVDEVLAFQAADKYVRVITAQAEYLIRTPLKALMAQLPAGAFWQIHRATLVRADALDKVVRDESGALSVHLRGLSETFAVSRLFAAQFKAM